MTDAEASAQIENQDEVVAAAGEGQPKKMRTKKKVLLITLLVILASLVVVYAAGALFFSSHFYPNTRFNDEDISYQADTAFVDKVEAQVDVQLRTSEHRSMYTTTSEHHRCTATYV